FFIEMSLQKGIVNIKVMNRTIKLSGDSRTSRTVEGLTTRLKEEILVESREKPFVADVVPKQMNCEKGGGEGILPNCGETPYGGDSLQALRDHGQYSHWWWELIGGI
ncbi:hypothetical protein HAX54_045579, partial [Datura stramonium]|nr:hypothetical protein [Datura stramonium]